WTGWRRGSWPPWTRAAPPSPSTPTSRWRARPAPARTWAGSRPTLRPTGPRSWWWCSCAPATATSRRRWPAASTRTCSGPRAAPGRRPEAARSSGAGELQLQGRVLAVPHVHVPLLGAETRAHDLDVVLARVQPQGAQAVGRPAETPVHVDRGVPGLD